MNARKLTENVLQTFCQYLIGEEKSAATVEKYIRDVRHFAVYAAEEAVTKELVMAYKEHLQKKEYSLTKDFCY